MLRELPPDRWYWYRPADYPVSTNLTECVERGCRIGTHLNVLQQRYEYQHGDNPEHVLIVNLDEMQEQPWLVQHIRVWTERIHAYEEGRWSPKDEA